MLYEPKLKEAMLDVLENRMSSIANTIQALYTEGYIPNKKKETVLNWSIALLNAYDSIDVLSKEQQNNLDRLYNKVLTL